MEEIKKKIQEINDWADAEGRYAFVMVVDGENQSISMHSSVNALASMLAGAMKEEEDIRRAVHKAVAMHGLDK